MQRDFRLSEVNVDRFNVLARQIGNTRHYFEREGHIYSEIKAPDVVYTSVSDILLDVQDDIQIPRCIWFPGDRPIGDARIFMQKDTQGYFRMLPRIEESYSELLIELGKPKSKSQANNDDKFKFYKEHGVWRLRYTSFRLCNFDLYNLEGLRPDMSNINQISSIKPFER